MSSTAPSKGHGSRAHTTHKRAVRESWTHGDCVAALIQASLLSYHSAEDAENTITWPWPGNNFRYVRSAPEGYEHNAPWNDWTTPSRAMALFEIAQILHAAAETPPVTGQKRVQVVLTPHLDLHAPTLVIDQLIRQLHQIYKDGLWANLEIGNGVGNARPARPYIAFATIEIGLNSTRCLQCRRGNVIIATMTLESLLVEHVGPNVLGLLAPGLITNLVYVQLDSHARIAKFLALA